MSILFGIRKAVDQIVEDAELRDLAQMTTAWAKDGTFLERIGSIGMGVQPFHTHARSRLDGRPTADDFGNLVALDGRLDNYADLIRRLSIEESNCSDSMIVLTAFLHWGAACFAHFIGDWAIALWSSSDRSLYLARDHAGTRTLYYEQQGGNVSWGTFFESFFVGGKRRELDERFAARYLSSNPLGTNTPYKGIQAVPAAHFIRLDQEGSTLQRHWTPVVDDAIRYHDDHQYDEQFLELFERSVRRRIGTADPVIAQLSGGMDSSSIVCMADQIRQREGGLQVKTLSFFDETEPSWNETPYFTAVEAHRRQTGIHIPVSMSQRSLLPYLASEGGFLPVGGDSSMVAGEKMLTDALPLEGCRALLSGVGGDELLGGCASALPELASYLTTLKLRSFFCSSVRWSLPTRTPVFLLWQDVLVYCRALYLPRADGSLPPWIRPRLKEHLLDAKDPLIGGRRFERSPQTIARALTWQSVLETLPNNSPPIVSRYEYRFPYLDRDFVEYLLRVPPEEMVQPGRRRYMMRRALRGIVPSAILERPRKGFILRGPLALLRDRQREMAQLFEPLSGPIDYLIDRSAFERALGVIRGGTELKWMPSAMRTIDLAIWLRSRNGIAQ